MIVLKIGGRQLGSAEFLTGLAEAVGALPYRPVIVHGGGKGTTELYQRLNLEPRFVAGQRYTDEAGLQAAVMGLVGEASTQLVSALVRHGHSALGLSGVDAGLVKVKRYRSPEGDLGLVGKPVEVAAEKLKALGEAGFLPCLAPISMSAEGEVLNVNADVVASALAAALDSEALVFLTDTPGVLREEQPISQLGVKTGFQLIEEGVIGSGMIPKVESAAEALAGGVGQVFITNLEGLRQWSLGQKPATEVVGQ